MGIERAPLSILLLLGWVLLGAGEEWTGGGRGGVDHYRERQEELDRREGTLGGSVDGSMNKDGAS